MMSLWPWRANAKCANFQFRPVSSLSIQDVGRLSAPEIVGSVSVAWFDVEDRPWFQKRPAIALIMARLGDLGEIPVAGILYSDIPLELEKNADSPPINVANFVSSDQDPSCQRFTFSVAADGKVKANGKLVGHIKQ
jgi:hypothetical protein